MAVVLIQEQQNIMIDNSGITITIIILLILDYTYIKGGIAYKDLKISLEF